MSKNITININGQTINAAVPANTPENAKSVYAAVKNHPEVEPQVANKELRVIYKDRVLHVVVM